MSFRLRCIKSWATNGMLIQVISCEIKQPYFGSSIWSTQTFLKQIPLMSRCQHVGPFYKFLIPKRGRFLIVAVMNVGFQHVWENYSNTHPLNTSMIRYPVESLLSYYIPEYHHMCHVQRVDYTHWGMDDHRSPCNLAMARRVKPPFNSHLNHRSWW